MEVIVTFLALLELIRRGEMLARQERVFGEILVSRRHDQVSMGLEEAPLGTEGADAGPSREGLAMES
jgi:chromatin segregation and condensation protein Rec8/ScpA/Scc1 (kleisin family)